MKVCPKCASDNPDSASFCNNCGTRLLSESAVTENKQMNQQLPGQTMHPRWPVALMIAGILLSCVGLTVCAFVAVKRGYMVEWLPAAHSSTKAVLQTVTGAPTVALVHTQAPSVTLALQLTETPTLTPVPALTSTLKASDTPSPTATPTITPTSTPMICAIPVYKAFDRIWESHKEELGCALYDANLNLLMAHEIFERGSMIWRQDDDRIYALYDNGIWASYEDIWKEGDAEFTCGTPANPPTPKRGLGKIWCTYDEVRNGLGDATTAEVGQYGRVQLFEHGFVLQTQYGDIFVFLYTGRWWQN